MYVFPVVRLAKSVPSSYKVVSKAFSMYVFPVVRLAKSVPSSYKVVSKAFSMYVIFLVKLASNVLCNYLHVGGGGWGVGSGVVDEVFTWPYPLKVLAYSSRDHGPDIRCKVSG